MAVNFPAALREGLWTAAAPLRALDLPVRWVPASGYHLTLKFLGDVPESRIEDLSGALEHAVRGARPLPVTVEGFGAFPHPSRASVIWAGVVNEPALELLQHGVEQAFGPLGFPPEGRPFRPHVTIGRARRNGRPPALDSLDALAWSDTATVGTVELMRSTTGPGGAVYEELRHGRLS